jgi:plasmid stabilization system protein ParE
VNRSTRIADAASTELHEAVHWYETQQISLGGKLFDAVADAVNLIQRHPGIGKPVSRKSQTRQLLVEGFPFQIVYYLTESEIAIVAVAHAKRRPGYWKNRD